MTSLATARPKCLNMSGRRHPSLCASPPWVSNSRRVRKGGIIAALNFQRFVRQMCFLSAGESGSADTVRDPRGFAVKFYTEDGNWDLTGNNTPIFFIRDALLVCLKSKNLTVCFIINQTTCLTCHSWFLYTYVQFPSFIHTQKRNPQTHMKDPDMVWDFWSLRPEGLHQVSATGPSSAAEHTYQCREW